MYCPIVARFLLVLYTNQLFRVKWRSHVSGVSNVSNGVKQGGVLSPLLFSVYIDELLCRLQNADVGCSIGTTFCGALGYADDITLLAPTAAGTRTMLNICHLYAQEYNVLFNVTKSKLIVCTPKYVTSPIIPTITFMGKNLDVISRENHLGVLIGNSSQEHIISTSVHDFLTRVNMVKHHFKQLPPDIMYNLFKTYCMPLYGCPLWDFSKQYIDKFFVSWRKAIRYILQIPNTTHSRFLHLICNDRPIKEVLYSRLIRFIHSLITSENHVNNICVKLALSGSNSAVGNNITVVSEYFDINRYILPDLTCAPNIALQGNEDHCISSLINELLHIRHMFLFMPHDFFILNLDQCNFMIYSLCTS